MDGATPNVTQSANESNCLPNSPLTWSNRAKKPSKKSKEKYKINYKEAIDAIGSIKNKLGGSALFGNEKDKSFRSSLENISDFSKKGIVSGS